MGQYTWRDARDILDFRELENIREQTSYAIQSQYSASRHLMALAAGFQMRIDPHLDIELFYQMMFNIYTAQGIGLDIWGVILGIGRNINGPYTGEQFGFDGSELAPFNQAPFTPDTGTYNMTSLITLDDESFRLLLLYKALANISASDAATLNKLLTTLVDTGVGGFEGVAYVLEVDTMVIRWVFENNLTPMQLAIFKVAGTLARGAGVGWEIQFGKAEEMFGFDGSEMQPFNQAPFWSGQSTIYYRS